MPTLPGSPTYSPIAVPDWAPGSERQELPFRLMMHEDWIRHFSLGRDEINKASRQQAFYAPGDLSAALGLTSLPIGSLNTGIWRVSYYLETITPATTSSSYDVTITWTSNGVSKSFTGAAINGNVVTDYQFGTLPIRSDANGPISISTSYSSTGATALVYRIRAIAEELALESA